MIKDEIAKIINNHDRNSLALPTYIIADAILNLPHPKLSCTIGEALEKAPVMIRRINAQEKMLIAYRVGSSKIAEGVFDEMNATENVLVLPDGKRIEVKK